MNLNVIKSKLESFSRPTQKEKVDYSKIYFKPKPGEYQIRIVPSKFDKDNPFKEVYFHYGISKFPLLALSNWKEKDPIIESVETLRNTKASKEENIENWRLAKKIEPKMRVFAPIIIRGQESEGVRLWEFGVEVYRQLLSLADDPDYGDYTSITNGRDFKIKVEESLFNGRKINKITSINIRPKESVLTDDKSLLEKIKDEQPDVLSLHKKYTYDEIKKIFSDWIESSEEKEEPTSVTDLQTADDINTNDLPFEVEKTSNLSKFDKLFEK